MVSEGTVWRCDAKLLREVEEQKGNPLRDDWLGAARGGNSLRVSTLLDQNPSLLEERGLDGSTALSLAAKYGMTEVVEFLLSKGANVSSKDEMGRTPLILAVEFGHAEIAGVLIAKGADVNAKSDSGQTPLTIAESRSENQTVAILRQLPDPGRYHPLSQAEIQLRDDWLGAAEFGRLEKVKAVLDKHPDLLESSNRFGETALYGAAVTGMTQVVEFLLSKGANVNASDRFGKTVLMMSADYGHAETARVLIAKGAAVSAMDKAGHTASYFAKHCLAPKKACSEVRDVLLQHGAQAVQP